VMWSWLCICVHWYCSVWSEVRCHLPSHIPWQRTWWRHSCSWTYGSEYCMHSAWFLFA